MDCTVLLKALQSHGSKHSVSQNTVQGNYMMVLFMSVPMTSVGIYDIRYDYF